MSTNSTRQVMTMFQKGQIFKLWKFGATLESIASITGYSVERLKTMIEGVFDTKAATEAIVLWEEHIVEKQQQEEDNNGPKTTIEYREVGWETKAVAGTHHDNGPHTIKEHGVRKAKKRVPRLETERPQVSVGRGERRSGDGNQTRTNGHSVLDTYRNSKEYKGEL